MNNVSLSRPENVEQLRLGLGAAVILGMTLACLAVVSAGWARIQGPIRAYPASTALGLPRLTVPNTSLGRCPSWALIVDSRYATADSPDRVMTWYQEARRAYVNQQPGAGARRLITRYEVGPLRFAFQRTAAVSIAGNKTQIYLTTTVEIKACP